MGNGVSSSNNMNRPRIANSLVLGGGGSGGGGKNGLGLSKQELDERCRPSGLYKTCQWDDKVLRRLIGDGRLASRKTTALNSTSTTAPAGADGAPFSSLVTSAVASWECPICFCNYEEINRTTCCEKEICTECYLQLKPPQKNINVPCPFCVGQKLKVERCLQTPPKESLMMKSSATVATVTGADAEGKRDSADSTDAPSSPSQQQPPPRSAYCLTPEQRKKLEAKVAEQQIHPLAARLAQEEAERRLANELHYLTSNPNLIHSLQHQQQQHHLHHLHTPSLSSSSSSSATSFRQQPLQQQQLLQPYPGAVRTMLLTEEQQLAMAIEASLRTGP